MKPLALFALLMMCSPLAADEVSDLIKQLDAPNFQDREQAAEKLEAQGKKAVAALAEAAETGTLETAVRSIQILQNLMESKDKAAADEAKSALVKLGESKNTATARRAKSASGPQTAAAARTAWHSQPRGVSSVWTSRRCSRESHPAGNDTDRQRR